MPVIATPLNVAESPSSLSAAKVREFLRDYAEKNPLLGVVEFSDSEITTSIQQAVERANAIGRPTTWTVSSFPNKYVLRLGAVSYLLKSETFRQIRNEATYQDGNIQPIGIDNKQQGYLSLSDVMSQEFIQLVTSLKIAENMSATRGLRSPLRRF